MSRMNRSLSFILLAWLLVADVGAQTAVPDFVSWRIVNRFRLLHPWFGLPKGEAPTLMNAGLHTDPLLELEAEPYANTWTDEDPKDLTESQLAKCLPAVPQASTRRCPRPLTEPKFYGCLYALSHGERPSHCQGLSHGNYHELFNWNPLTYRYEAPPGVPYPKGYKANPVGGDWIIELELRRPVSAAGDCEVSATYQNESPHLGTPLIDATECRGALVRFAIPVKEGDTTANTIKVEVKSAGATIAKGTISPTDELMVAIGDSFGSGEGNPDLAGLLDREHPSSQFLEEPVWLDRRCNRSMHASPARAAMQLAAEKRDSDADHPEHRSVTFLSFACSGAKITEGLLNRYDGVKNAQQVAEYLIDQYKSGSTILADSAKRAHLERLQQRYAPEFARNAPNAEGMETKTAQEGEIPTPFPKEFYHRLPPQLEALQSTFCKDSQNGKCNNPRKDINLMISIGGNDIGFASLIADFIVRRSKDFSTVSSWPAVQSGGPDRIRQDYAKEKGFRDTVGLAEKVSNDIDYLKNLFNALNERLPNNEVLYKEKRGESATEPFQQLSTKDVFVIGYPSPNHDEAGNLCKNQNFLGLPLLGLLLRIGDSESDFAEKRIVNVLRKKFESIARENRYILVDVTTSQGDVFTRRGWCALGQLRESAEETWADRGKARCQRDSFAHDPSWKAYCTRNRWFRTLADSAYTQGPLVGGIPNGAMHPTFEAHRYIGWRIHDEVLNSPPDFEPLGDYDLRKEACKASINPSPTCAENDWLKGGKFDITVRDRDKLNLARTSCELVMMDELKKNPVSSRQCPGGPLVKEPEEAKWSFDFGLDPMSGLPDDGSYQIALKAVDTKGKQATRKYNVKIDRHSPEIVCASPHDAKAAASHAWASNRAIHVRAKDCESKDCEAKDREAKDGSPCSGSGVAKLDFHLAASADATAPGDDSRPTCSLAPTFDPKSCLFTADLAFPEAPGQEKCRSATDSSIPSLPAVFKVWVRAVDKAGWTGKWVEVVGPRFDLVDPELRCERGAEKTKCPD